MVPLCLPAGIGGVQRRLIGELGAVVGETHHLIRWVIVCVSER